MPRSFVTVLSLLLLGSLPALAESPRERLETLLSHHERVPTRAQLLAVSPDAERLLQEMVQSPSRRILARTRALAVLRHFPGETTARLLRETIQAIARGQGSPLALLDLQQALPSYAVVAGAGSLDLLQGFLAHPSPDVRRVAVVAVGLVRSPRVLGLLEGRRRVEPSPMVRYRLDRELTRLRAR